MTSLAPAPLEGAASAHGTGARLTTALLLTLAYVGAALVGIKLGRPPAGASGLWVANVLVIAAMLRQDERDWPLSFAAALLGSVVAVVGGGLPERLASGFALANLTEIAVAVFAIRALFGPVVSLRRGLSDYLRLQAIAAGLAPALGSAVAAACVTAQPGAEASDVFWGWWGGSAMGAILVLPVAVTASRDVLWRTFFGPQAKEFFFFAMICPVAMVLAIAFFRFPFVLFSLPLAIAAVRTNPFSTAVIALVSVVGVVVTRLFGWLPLFPAAEGAVAGPVTFFAGLAVLMPFCISLLVDQQREERRRIGESEERFRNAMEHSAIGMALVGTNGAFLKVNRALCDMLGYEADELQAKTFQEITHADDLAGDLDLVGQVLTGKIDSYRMEKRYWRKDGRLVWALLAVSCVREKATGSTLYFVSQIEDISARKTAETELEKSESRWNFALASARQGVWDYDATSQTTFFSPVWKEILGYRDDELSSRDPQAWLEHVHGDDLQRLRAAIDDHLEGRSDFFEVEFRMRHKSGCWVWVLDRGKVAQRDADGKPIRLIGTHTDITSRKESETKIEQLSQRIHLAVEAGRVGLWEFNPETRELWWDEQMRDLYGAAVTDLTGTYSDWRARVHPDDWQRVDTLGRSAFREGARYDTEFRIVLPNGQTRYIRALADVVRDADGVPRRLVGTNWDITEKRRLTDALLQEKERLRITLESIGDGVVSVDTDSRITFINSVAEELTGWSAAEAVGQPLEGVIKTIEEATGESMASPVAACLAGETVKTARDGVVLLSRKGRRDIRQTAAPVRTASNEIVGAVIIFHDMSEARRLQRQLAHSASHDALTGLANRSAFEFSLRAACDLVAESNRQHALCFIDLDRFKIVNDTAGHAAGDALLREIGRTIRQNVRGHDVMARLGGDEFGLLLYDCSLEQAELVAAKMIDSIRSIPFMWDGRAYDVGASVGLTVISAASSVPGELLSQADIACYTAKSLGRNRVAAYRLDESDARRHHRDLQIAARIRGAIETDRFSLYAQEIRPLQSRVRGERHYEILLRMLDDDGSVLQPDLFIPAAERYDLMGNIDRWVMRKLLRNYGPRIAAEPGLSLSVNVSANSLSDPTFWPFLEAELAASGLDAGRLRLEITETSLINNMSASIGLVEAARAAGCAIVLDDFGTGLSSFAYLKRFPIDYLKIDGSFMRSLKGSAVDRTIVESINDIAHKLGAATIAEWVEDAETAEIIRSIGVDHAQGYAIAMPVPLDDILSEAPYRAAAVGRRRLAKIA